MILKILHDMVSSILSHQRPAKKARPVKATRDSLSSLSTKQHEHKKSCPAVTCIPSNMQSRYMYHGSHTCTNQDEILKNWIQLNVVTRSNHCHPNYILLQERFFLLHFVGPQQELLSINLAIQAHACYMWDIIICYFSPACPHTQSWG